MKRKARRVWRGWGGFVDDELDWQFTLQDRVVFAVYKHRESAKMSYEDVRPVTITLSKRKRKSND